VVVVGCGTIRFASQSKRSNDATIFLFLTLFHYEAIKSELSAMLVSTMHRPTEPLQPPDDPWRGGEGMRMNFLS
jgi:hypothetical protein